MFSLSTNVIKQIIFKMIISKKVSYYLFLKRKQNTRGATLNYAITAASYLYTLNLEPLLIEVDWGSVKTEFDLSRTNQIYCGTIVLMEKPCYPDLASNMSQGNPYWLNVDGLRENHDTLHGPYFRHYNC